jgi:hypothetical protein
MVRFVQKRAWSGAIHVNRLHSVVDLGDFADLSVYVYNLRTLLGVTILPIVFFRVKGYLSS